MHLGDDPTNLKRDREIANRTQRYALLLLNADEARKLFRKYYDIQGVEFQQRNNAYRNELSAKLQQLHYCLLRLGILSQELDRAYQRKDTDSWQLAEQLLFYTEAFYWFAWRTRQAIQFIPGLKRFDCVGVRNVRNKLIEHPEEKNGPSGVGGGWGITSDGVTLHVGRDHEHHRRYPDYGMIINGEEFFDNLISMLSEALDNIRT